MLGIRDRFLSIHATIHNSFDGRRLVISSTTHRVFRFPAMPTDAMSLLRQEPSVPGDLLHALFSNVTVALHQQMKFFPCNSLQTRKYFPGRR
jgi:hypothetical protein